MRLKLQVFTLFGVMFLLSHVGCSQDKAEVQTGEGPTQYDKQNQPVQPGTGFRPRGSQEADPAVRENANQGYTPNLNPPDSSEKAPPSYVTCSSHYETTAINGTPRSLSISEISLSFGVLVFSAAVLWGLLQLRLKKAITGDIFFKSFGLIIVVGSSLFLISAGWSQTQITPIVGLLGTVIGFVFGKSAEHSRVATSKDETSTKTIKDVPPPNVLPAEKKDAESP